MLTYADVCWRYMYIAAEAGCSRSGTRFTCFTGTKVQILTLYVHSSRGWMLKYADVC
jgi:hypothetical protein